jgi:hypothetical protein
LKLILAIAAIVISLCDRCFDNSVLILIRTKYLRGYNTLEKEAVTVASLFKTKAITGKDATETAFKEKLSVCG